MAAPKDKLEDPNRMNKQSVSAQLKAKKKHMTCVHDGSAMVMLIKQAQRSSISAFINKNFRKKGEKRNFKMVDFVLL